MPDRHALLLVAVTSGGCGPSALCNMCVCVCVCVCDCVRARARVGG